MLFAVALAVSLRLALAPLALAQQQAPVIIKELTVEGNRRVQEAVILGRVQSKLGTAFNPALLSEDVRAVFALGFFDDVRLKVEDFEGGVKVTFDVVERPFVRDVGFTGNKKVTTVDLQEKIDLKLGSVYNPVDVQKAIEKLKEKYEEEGYYEVQITPNVEKFADGDVRLTFAINEGRRMTIDTIVIRGNRAFTAAEVKDALATQERQFFILRGTIQRQKLDEDVERILQLYNDHGYIQARVEGHEVTVDRERARVTLTFTVVEGPQYRVSEIRINGVTLLPVSDVRRALRIKEGEVFGRGRLRDSLKSVEDLYSTIGRASADVTPRTDPDPATAKVAVTLEINEGPEVYVERINIAGNTRSQDKILRREIPMVEGDLFTLQKMNWAKARLTNLGYFESVNVGTQPGSDKTKIIVNIDVTERPTGLFSIGGGYSSVDNFVGTIDLAQRNFLGKGWEAAVRIRAGAQTQQGMISFTEPWMFDRPLSAGFDLYSTQRIFTEYNYNSLGTTLRMSHPFLDYWRWFTSYRISQDRITHLTPAASEALLAQTGKRITSAIGGSVVRDTRDNGVATNKGGLFSVATDLAGLGGDAHFVKAVATATYFKPIWLGHILSGRVEGAAGWSLTDEPLPIFERYYLGGPNSVRSFKFRRISPLDENGNRIGGSSELLGNVEYIVPLPFNIRLAGFFDVGNVYGFGTTFDPSELKQAVGGGMRWISPFGPIRLDYGINANRRKGEDFGTFNFSVGSPF
ncbi:MAG: outer membrane protein assembly factor BamA [Candidatus Rokubacteria bacterium]|nr:outer membrane protein assembly factor BamA [Candidatus Rokubacteria bacterium]MBI3827760.1 outer membrane protein assembly factor BamA [Candidatus Rokubacteria bacterium]